MDLLNQMIGRRIRRLRLERGLSQMALGVFIGASTDEIELFEKGAKRVGAARLVRIAVLFDVDVSTFFEARDGTQKVIEPEDDRRQPDGSRHSLH